MESLYCVVRDKQQPGCSYSFTKFHETEELAVEESKRLCEKHNERFYVLKVIGCAERRPNPVDYFSVK